MFRFSIRELVLVTVIAAVSVAWWLDRGEVERRGEMRAAVIQQGADKAAIRIADLEAATAAHQLQLVQIIEKVEWMLKYRRNSE